MANKEETESLFAENRKAVTLLVSRCLNKVTLLRKASTNFTITNGALCFLLQSDEYIENESFDTSKTVAYQNSIIEQIVQQTEAQPPCKGETGPRIPPHYHDKLNLTNSLVRSKIDSINHEISELDHRMQNIQLVKLDKRKPPQLPHIPAPPESDTEHIYETIPESLDSEIEPIYSCPYDGSDSNVIEHWLKTHDGRWTPPAKETGAKSKETKSKTKSSKSNSSGEEHENSSSAYNTGGSCNSNPLTFELACSADAKQKDTYRSTLVLCPPPESLQDAARDRDFADKCELCKQHSKQKKKSSKMSPQSPTTRTIFNPALLGDTMYTNVANLQQTMLLQQQLFRQAMGHQSVDAGMKPSTSFTTPSLSQYQFGSGHRVSVKSNKELGSNEIIFIFFA